MFGTVNLWRFGQHASRALGRRIRIAECDVMGVDVVTRSDVLRSIADKLCVFANRCACLHRHGCDLVTRGSTPVAQHARLLLQQQCNDTRPDQQDRKRKDLDADEWQEPFEDVCQADVGRGHGFQVKCGRPKGRRQEANLHVHTEHHTKPDRHMLRLYQGICAAVQGAQDRRPLAAFEPDNSKNVARRNRKVENPATTMDINAMNSRTLFPARRIVGVFLGQWRVLGMQLSADNDVGDDHRRQHKAGDEGSGEQRLDRSFRDQAVDDQNNRRRDHRTKGPRGADHTNREVLVIPKPQHLRQCDEAQQHNFTTNNPRHRGHDHRHNRSHNRNAATGA
ncbi:hypothetical protein GQR58_030310 [Nymphon striatum]|nr:hypothetical protein GQR58_030310 [Nymphon striatum]